MKHLILSIIICFFPYYIFAQQKTDLEKDELNGKIKSIYAFNTNAEGTVPYSKTYYNENGMKTKFISLYRTSETDSIEYHYDDRSRLIKEIEYRVIYSRSDDEFIGTRTDTTFYQYENPSCDKPTEKIKKFGDENKPFNDKFIYDEKCRVIQHIQSGGSAETKITEKTFDNKNRLIKKTLTYKGKKPDIVETYDYNDQDLTMVYLEFSARYNVYREKEFVRYNEANKKTEHFFYYQPKWGSSITFTDGYIREPDSVYLIKRYVYDDNNKLTKEIHLDGQNKEILKVDVFYDEEGVLQKQCFYRNGIPAKVEEYTYINDELTEEKIYIGNEKELAHTKTWKYDESGNLLEYTLTEKDGGKFLYQYIYDTHGNEREKRKLTNENLIETLFTEIEYYP